MDVAVTFFDVGKLNVLYVDISPKLHLQRPNRRPECSSSTPTISPLLIRNFLAFTKAQTTNDHLIVGQMQLGESCYSKNEARKKLNRAIGTFC